MEVDYVRVYDGFFPYLSGNRRVAYRAQGEWYRIGNLPADASVSWEAPDDATIVEGQGTGEVRVDWGARGGLLHALVSSPCGERDLKLDVAMAPAFAPVRTLEDFDNPALINYAFSTGTFNAKVPNPAPDEVNSSALCGRYQRDNTQRYDVLIYHTEALRDADEFIREKQKFYLDVYSDAPVGTLILLQLENRQRAGASNYPVGRHSRFEARTTLRGAWQRLEFELLDQPDPATAGATVDQLVLLFASDSFNGSVYYFDNFQVYGIADITGTTSAMLPASNIGLFPNPAGDSLMLENKGDNAFLYFIVFDAHGRLAATFPQSLAPGDSMALPLGALSPGVYHLYGATAQGTFATRRFVKQ
jgi:hypothetical protein